METRAHHLLVGAFVLTLVAACFLLVLWIASDEDRGRLPYLVFFEGSVGGLGEGGDVRYRGIPIGTVTHARVDPGDPRRVAVEIEVADDVPIREGDVATLKLQGITGSSYVDISGAGPTSPPLVPPPGQRMPVIPSRPSALEQLFEGAPDLISQGTVAATGVSEIVGRENQQAIRDILVNVEQLTSALAARDQQIGRILDSFEATVGELSGAANSVGGAAERVDLLIAEADRTLVAARSAIETVDGVVDEDFAAMLADFGETAQTLERLAGEAEGLVAENREPLREFTTQGLPELENFVLEARLLVAQLSRIAGRLEDEGLGFLLGSQDAGYEAGE